MYVCVYSYTGNNDFEIVAFLSMSNLDIINDRIFLLLQSLVLEAQGLMLYSANEICRYKHYMFIVHMCTSVIVCMYVMNLP